MKDDPRREDSLPRRTLPAYGFERRDGFHRARSRRSKSVERRSTKGAVERTDQRPTA
jgi:hypothetical protein